MTPGVFSGKITHMTTRREWLQMTAGVVFLGAVQKPAGTDIEIWKSPTCGCCEQWVAHVRANGFSPRTHDVPDVAPYKRKYGVPQALESCHTAIVGGYAIEGHVPADVIRQALAQKPQIAGLAVPGMPMGSPGMEGPRKDNYDVVAFDKTGK